MEPATRYGYGEIYVDGSPERVLEAVAAAVGCAPDRDLLKLETHEVEVGPGPNRPYSPDDWLNWPTLVEIVHREGGQDDMGTTALVRSLLQGLRGSGFRAVLAADYEDELGEGPPSEPT